MPFLVDEKDVLRRPCPIIDRRASVMSLDETAQKGDSASRDSIDADLQGPAPRLRASTTSPKGDRLPRNGPGDLARDFQRSSTLAALSSA